MTDPNELWSLPRTERLALAEAQELAQAEWLPRLDALIEPPRLHDSFPAFLLESPAFEGLKQAMGDATHRRELDTATADELQHFVDRYRCYLLQTDDEIETERRDLLAL